MWKRVFLKSPVREDHTPGSVEGRRVTGIPTPTAARIQSDREAVWTMSKDLLVRFEIPIPVHRIVNTPAMIFGHWMPLTEDEFIVVQEEDATLKLWFDKSCWHRVTRAGGDISRHRNVLVNKILADVTLHNVSNELVDYIRLAASGPHPSPGPYQQEYLKLGQRVYLLTLIHLNRLIDYVRSTKGQYWLRKYPVDKVDGTFAVNLAFNARVNIDSEWFRWLPDVRQLVIGREGGCQDENRFIDRDTWSEAREFVASPRRTSLVWELLAGAEWLAGIGHRRSALTEAVTALEVAVFEFAGLPRAQEAFGPLITDRMNVTSLRNWVKRMGLSGTICYLFPVIFREENMSTDLLKGCQEAVQQRQNVVHSTPRRDVPEDKLSWYLHSIRNMCAILEAYQNG